MCGYCVETSACETWATGTFEIGSLDENLRDTSAFNAHILPEFTFYQDLGLPYLLEYKRDCELLPWLLYKKSINTSLSKEEMNCGQNLLTQHSLALDGLTEDDFLWTFPVLRHFLSKFNFNYQISPKKEDLQQLLDECERYIKEISNHFKTHMDKKYFRNETQAPKIQRESTAQIFLLLGTNEDVIPSHPAFEQFPLALYFATELLMQFKPHSVMLVNPILAIFDAPSFCSHIMAWQRYLATHAILHLELANQPHKLIKMRLFLLYYLGLRFSSNEIILKKIIQAIREIPMPDSDYISRKQAMENLVSFI